MASNQVNINLSLQDQTSSIKKRTEEVKGLNKELQKAQQYTTGTKTGARAAAASFGAGENIEYGRARGSMGSTGASGRDFANQAQGLGGLVRLYATYAANVFAVSAAFQALREAMNTTNMVRGLDQLGTATGTAMGSLAKRFSEASGGAISLRESMESTAKALSSGMTQKQFLQLGEVAKKASQALGINMPDAVSRLTRGISKLEPELLDELGLFTKVGKASEDYARSVGKSVDSLTDFEKRQAFANAVLKEGIDKFSNIDIPTNPYDRLLATLKNVTQGILEVVNKAVVPLIDFLSKSPTALTGVIAGLSILILRQALPVFTSYREAMQKATAEAALLSEEKLKQARRSLELTRKVKADEVKLELDNIAQIKAEQVDAAESALRSVSKRGISKEVQTILRKPDILSINEKDLSVLDTLGSKQTKVAAQYRQLALAIREAQSANERYMSGVAAANEKVNAPARFGSAADAAQVKLESARRQAAAANLVGSVGETASTVGTIAASKELLSGLKTEKLGLFRGGLAAVSGAASIAAATISNLAAVFSRFLGTLAIASIAFEALDFLFSKNAKELDVFKSGLDNLAEATKTATNVAEKFGSTLSTDSINAKANAFANLTEGVNQTVNQLRSVNAVSSDWDKFIDGFKVIWGGNIRKRFEVGFVDSIAAAIKTAPEGKVKYELEQKLGALLKTENLGIEGIAEAVSEVPTDKLVDLSRNVSVILDESDKTLKKAQLVTQNVKETGKNASEAFLTFSNSVFGSSPLETFLQASTKNIVAIRDALKDSTGAAAEFANIASGATKLEFLPEQAIGDLQRITQEYNLINNGLKNQANNLERVRERINEISKLRNSFSFMSANKVQALVSEQESLQRSLPKLQADVTQVELVLKQKAKEAGEVMALAVGKQLELVFQQTKIRLQQLDVGFQQQVAALNPVKTAAGIKEQTSLAVRGIQIDIQLRKSNESLINSIDLLRVQMEVTTAKEAFEAAKLDTSAAMAPMRAEKEQALLAAENKLAALRSGKMSELQKYAATDPGIIQSAQRRQSSEVLNREQANKIRIQELKGEIELSDLVFDNRKQSLEFARQEAQLKLEEKKRTPGFLGGEPAALAAVKAAEEELVKFLEPINKALDVLGTEREEAVANIALKLGKDQAVKDEVAATLAQRKQRQTTLSGSRGVVAVGTAEYNSMLAQAAVFDAERVRSEEEKMMFAKANYDTGVASINSAKEELNLLASRGAITEQQAAQQLQTLTNQQAQLDLVQKLKEIEKTRFLAQLEYSKKVLEGADEQSTEMKLQYSMIQSRAALDNEAAQRDFQAKLKTADITASLADKQTQYENVFRQSFDNMADAMVEFAKTGKLSFSSLISTMVEGILRLELQMQSKALYSLFRPAIAGLFAPAPGSLDYGPVGPTNAKGGVYDTGLKTFAKGGMFTNSIVSQPTLFKFGKGTGLMGEAGPEAIMPLKRDSNGNLGVRAGGNGGSVDVVVNNYGSEKATTKETTDSRGNRKIEVVIGDMVAGEMSRSGSSLQQTFSNTFGTRPSVPRR
jgi:lambda family phage tail tape measure protein